MFCGGRHETIDDCYRRRRRPACILEDRHGRGGGNYRLRLVGGGSAALADEDFSDRPINKGDAAILRFLAAVEIIETDLWQQYNELGGIQDAEVPGGGGSPLYTAALKNLDGDMDQYIHDNTEDELTHETFINAYLTSKGVPAHRP